jgi:CheY-like chemotaxis protein
MNNVIYLAGRDQPASLLLVEREPLLRSKVAAHLRRAGFSVLEAVSGDEALKLLRSGRTILLVLGDLQRHGPDWAAAIRIDFPRVKLLDYSASDIPRILQSGTLKIEGSVDLSALKAALRTLIGGLGRRT